MSGPFSPSRGELGAAVNADGNVPGASGYSTVQNSFWLLWPNAGVIQAWIMLDAEAEAESAAQASGRQSFCAIFLSFWQVLVDSTCTLPANCAFVAASLLGHPFLRRAGAESAKSAAKAKGLALVSLAQGIRCKSAPCTFLACLVLGEGAPATSGQSSRPGRIGQIYLISLSQVPKQNLKRRLDA